MWVWKTSWSPEVTVSRTQGGQTSCHPDADWNIYTKYEQWILYISGGTRKVKVCGQKYRHTDRCGWKDGWTAIFIQNKMLPIITSQQSDTNTNLFLTIPFVLGRSDTMKVKATGMYNKSMHWSRWLTEYKHAPESYLYKKHIINYVS